MGNRAGAGVAGSSLDHTQVLGLTVRILGSPLSQLGVEPGESLSRGELDKDMTSFLKNPLLDRSVSPQEKSEEIKVSCSQNHHQEQKNPSLGIGSVINN